jgi:hypothetical protein
MLLYGFLSLVYFNSVSSWATDIGLKNNGGLTSLEILSENEVVDCLNWSRECIVRLNFRKIMTVSGSEAVAARLIGTGSVAELVW